MAVQRLDAFAGALLAGGKDPQTPVALIENASRSDQRLVRTVLADAVQTAQSAEIKPPAIVVVGPVAGFTDADRVLGFGSSEFGSPESGGEQAGPSQ